MAKIKKRGESGAAKNYITRNQALKKLQVSLSDFRRLCILKGIYPREPLHKKRANKGSSAPASFYYHKDIQYLLHEPLLDKFREHKTFAKKLARALGRQEWALAKGLEERKPVARLDHLVKERYPTFTLALQDLHDPLNLVHLFSALPTAPVPGKTTVSPDVIAECGRLISEWKVWAIKAHALRKVFLGIKGVYYEVEVPGQSGETVRVRWLEGFEFQQHVPTDVDFRILLTFLDLYRTLVSFTLYKLYTDENLVYPPPLDVTLDESGEGVGAFRLVEKAPSGIDAAVIGENGKRVTKKEVRRQIKGIQSTGAGAEGDAMDEDEPAQAEEEADEDFVDHPSKSAVTEDVSTAPLPTYTSLLASTSAAALSSKANLLFSSYTFYLSRETSSRTWEFVIRALGGRVVLSLTSPSPSTAAEADSITHVLIDRPMEPARMREMEQGRKWTWVQPQWVADCCNQGRVLGKENYGPGEALPPHLSPWDGEGEAVRPWLDAADVDGHVVEADEEEEGMEVDEAMGSEDEDDEEQDVAEVSYPPALLASSLDPTNTTLLHAAELEAEATGVPHATFRANLKDAVRANAAEAKALASEKARKGAAKQGKDEDLRKIMMSGKKAKLYEKIKYSNREKQEEKELLESKRLALDKKRRKEARIMSIGKGGGPRK